MPQLNLDTAQLVTLRTDGGARGNPGPAGIGFTVEQDGTEVFGAGAFIGSHTNNVAEYAAILWGLQNVIAAGAQQVLVLADSELVVKQLNGQYKVKNAGLKPLYAAVVRTAQKLPSVRFEHIRRAQNSVADGYANEAMDAGVQTGSPVLPFSGSAADVLVGPPAQGTLF